MLAALTGSEENLIFLLLAVVAFGVAIYLAYVRNFVGAVIAAFIGLIVLFVAL